MSEEMPKLKENATDLEVLEFDLIESIQQYHDSWELPLAYDIISKSYSHRAKKYSITGELKGLMRELQARGLIYSTATPSGKNVVFPGAVAAVLSSKGTLTGKLVEYDSSPILGRKRRSGK